MRAGRRSALVTGGSSGIGLAIATVLAEEGHDLTLAARDADRLSAAAATLERTGAAVRCVAGDLRHEDAVQRAVDAHRADHGALDVLVNNAGAGLGQRVGEIGTSRLDVQLALNLRTPVLFYRECVPLLEAAAAAGGRALVVNVASAAGREGQPWLSVYSATKAGLIAFTQAMNAELADRRIHSCALCPGTVDTPLTRHLDVDRDRLIPASDLGEAVRLLARLSPRTRIPELVVEAARELSPEEARGPARGGESHGSHG